MNSSLQLATAVVSEQLRVPLLPSPPPRCELFIHVGHEQAGGTAVCLEYEEEEEHQHHGRLGADGRARTRREEGGNLVSASLWDCISCKLNEMLL